MNAFTPMRAEADLLADRVSKEVDAAGRVLTAAYKYRNALFWAEGFTDRTEYARFQLCNAIIELFDDGDALAVREIIMNELSIDEDGNPVRAVAV